MGALTAGDIRVALKKHFSAPEYAIIYDVAQATGFSAHRHLDAVAMDLWPSRGLTLHGIEIKISLHDWLRERADPAKAEEIARFCDYFWVAAPSDMQLPGLPEAWGRIAVEPDATIHFARPAAKTKAEPIGREFLAAALRAATRPVDPETLEGMLKSRRDALDRDFDARVQREAERLTDMGTQYAQNWKKLVEAVGEEGARLFADDQNLIAAAKAVMKVGATSTWSGLAALATQLDDCRQRISQAFELLGVDNPEAKKPKQKKKRTA